MKKEIDLEIPTTPNFIMAKVGTERVQISIKEFTEKELREIGESWTRKLIEMSKLTHHQ